MGKSKNTTQTDAINWAYERISVLAQLLIEAEVNLLALSQIPTEDITLEKVQDLAIHSIQGAINSVNAMEVLNNEKN